MVMTVLEIDVHSNSNNPFTLLLTYEEKKSLSTYFFRYTL